MQEQLPEFQKLQYEFAAHLRNPELNPAPSDVEERRMAIYRELFYNNIQNFIAGGFPVLRKLYSKQDWHRMIRHFYTNHQSHSPYFMEIYQEFLQYVQEEREPQPEDPVFMKELAHYEWAEIAVASSDDEIDWETIDSSGDLLKGRPVFSPLAWLLHYTFPVHKISPEFIPEAPGEQLTHLVVYRNKVDKVRFMEVNPVTARLITLIEEFPYASGEEHLQKIAVELQHAKPDVVIQGGKQTLARLHNSFIIPGTRR